LKLAEAPFFPRNFVICISPTGTGELNSHHQHKAMRVDGVLPDAPKGSFATLLSPQCHAAFGTMPHTTGDDASADKYYCVILSFWWVPLLLVKEQNRWMDICRQLLLRYEREADEFMFSIVTGD
jgi:hypothetical protein